MVKLVFCLRRRDDLSREEFQAYWRDHHAPLVASVADRLGIRRYVQTRTIDDRRGDALRRSRGGPEPYDGVAELWFDGPDALTVNGDDALAAARALLEDEARFIDLARSPIFLAEEHEIVRP